jgi:membrane-bound serine protease (ClpP class)
MMKKYLKYITSLVILFLFVLNVKIFAQENEVDSTEKTTRIYKFDIKEEIAPPVWHMVKKAFTEASVGNYDLVLIHMNTYGGLVDAADSIRTTILNSKIPVYVLIDNNAASAGALISIACDSIYMVPGANIGAATVVNQTGEAMPDKYQSYMRSMMRSTAEASGRDPDIAQAMVDDRIAIPGVIDSGSVLTFTTSEAIENGFCEGEVESIKDLLQSIDIIDYDIYTQQLTASDSIIKFLTSPLISGVLIMLIVGGLYFELQSPGIGFPLGAAILGAILYFAPLYIEGLVENWEIILFFVGIVLLAIELFVVPGFGFFGISGIVIILLSLALAMVGNDGFNFTIPDVTAIIHALIVVSFSSLIGIVASYYLSKKLFATNSMLNLSLATTQKREDGFGIEVETYSNVVGQDGTAYTDLRPSGKVKISNQIYDAIAVSGYISKNEKVVVMDYSNAQLIVKSKKDD